MQGKRYIGPLSSKLDWYKFSLSVGTEILSVLGAFWLIINVVRFFFPQLNPFLQSYWILGLGMVLTAGLSLWRRRPLSHVSARIPGRDVEIEIRIGNMFSLAGDYIISTTTSFDTVLSNGTVSSDSLIGQFIKRFYPNISHLNYDIEQSLIGQSFATLPETWQGERKKYEIGTVAQVKVPDHTVYLIGIADKNPHGNVSDNSTFEDVKTSLAMTWEHIRQRGELGSVVISLMGTGRARMNVTRLVAFKEIIQSFIAANSDRKLCEKLTVIIHPTDYKKHDLNLNEMWDYLRSTCVVTEFGNTAQRVVGTPLGVSLPIENLQIASDRPNA